MQLFTLCSVKFIFYPNTIALISKLRFVMCVRYCAMMMTELAVSPHLHPVEWRAEARLQRLINICYIWKISGNKSH